VTDSALEKKVEFTLTPPYFSGAVKEVLQKQHISKFPWSWVKITRYLRWLHRKRFVLLSPATSFLSSPQP
jgi:hypothetical protein